MIKNILIFSSILKIISYFCSKFKFLDVMKKVLFSLLILSIATSLSAQKTMPNFSEHGYKKPVMYSSKIGGFEEFHDKTDVVEIGTVLFNTKTNQVVGFIEEEEIEAEVSSSSAAISIDPHCERYPWISPYAYCMNNPIRYIDPDGRDWKDFLLGFTESLARNITVGAGGVSATNSVSNASHYNIGRNAGDVVSLAMGVGEVIGGSGTAAGGAVVTVGSAGTASPASIPAVIGGVAIVAHGSAMTGKAAASLMSQDGRISQASSSNSNESSNTSSGTSTSEKTRSTKGGDGATSKHIIERDSKGNTISKTHQVTDEKGNIIHQHQDHVNQNLPQGEKAKTRQFPDEWIQYPKK